MWNSNCSSPWVNTALQRHTVVVDTALSLTWPFDL